MFPFGPFIDESVSEGILKIVELLNIW